MHGLKQDVAYHNPLLKPQSNHGYIEMEATDESLRDQHSRQHRRAAEAKDIPTTYSSPNTNLLADIQHTLEENNKHQSSLQQAIQSLVQAQTSHARLHSSVQALLQQAHVAAEQKSHLPEAESVKAARKKSREKPSAKEPALNNGPSHAETQRQMDVLGRSLAAKEEELTKVREVMKQKCKDMENLQELEQDQRLLIAKLKLQYDQLKHEKQREHRSLTNELRQEKLKLETATETLNALQSQHKFSSEQVAGAQSEIDSLLKELFQLRRTSEESKRLLAKKSKELSSSENEANALRSDLQDAQVQVSGLHDSLNESTAREREKSSEILRLTSRIQTLEKRLMESMQSHEEEMASAASALEKNEKLRKVLLRDLQQSKSKLDLKQQLYSQVKLEYENQLSDLNERLAVKANVSAALSMPRRKFSLENTRQETPDDSKMTPRTKATFLREQIKLCTNSSLPKLQ